MPLAKLTVRYSEYVGLLNQSGGGITDAWSRRVGEAKRVLSYPRRGAGGIGCSNQMADESIRWLTSQGLKKPLTVSQTGHAANIQMLLFNPGTSEYCPTSTQSGTANMSVVEQEGRLRSSYR